MSPDRPGNHETTVVRRQVSPDRPGNHETTAVRRQESPDRPGSHETTAVRRQVSPDRPGNHETTAVRSMLHSHLVSKMDVLSMERVLLKWDRVKASSRLMLKRSCSQANISSARLIFLCTMEKSTGGVCACAAASRFCVQPHLMTAYEAD